jgi:hypothetical protein
LAPLYATDWVVYAKPPFGRPGQVLKYLARYTFRVAISNHRLLNLDNGRVTFRYKYKRRNLGADAKQAGFHFFQQARRSFFVS